MLFSLLLAVFWVLGTLGTILTFIACGFLGYWLAGKVPMPRWIGVVVGGFGHLAGCGILVAIWGIVWLAKGANGRALERIERATALLQGYGYTVTPPTEAK